MYTWGCAICMYTSSTSPQMSPMHPDIQLGSYTLGTYITGLCTMYVYILHLPWNEPDVFRYTGTCMWVDHLCLHYVCIHHALDGHCSTVQGLLESEPQSGLRRITSVCIMYVYLGMCNMYVWMLHVPSNEPDVFRYTGTGRWVDHLLLHYVCIHPPLPLKWALCIFHFPSNEPYTSFTSFTCP